MQRGECTLRWVLRSWLVFPSTGQRAGAVAEGGIVQSWCSWGSLVGFLERLAAVARPASEPILRCISLAAPAVQDLIPLLLMLTLACFPNRTSHRHAASPWLPLPLQDLIPLPH